MRSILGYIKGSWKAICVIIAMLIVQAYCELTLPTYMSEIVDVGIQQNGIENAVPEHMRTQSLQHLTVFMSEDESALIQDCYEADGDGRLILKGDLDSERIDDLNDAFVVPMVLVSGMEKSDMDINQLWMAIEHGQMTPEQLAMIREQAMEKMGDIPESTMQQMAILYVQNEYQEMGVDINQYRNHYLFGTGGKMLGLAFLGVMVAIVIGLLASRIGAKVGCTLRDGVLGHVLTFSSAEMNQFSTASLITRCTNDIQQVQMVIVMMLRMVLFAPICAIGGIIKVVHTHTGMGWIIVVAVLSIMGVVGTLVYISMPKFKKMQTLIDRLNLISREILTGIMPVRAFSREKHEEQRFAGANTDLMRTQMFTNRVMTFMMPTMMVIMNGISVMIIWFGSKGVDLGTLQVGDMMAFINYTMMIVMSFMMLTMMSIMLPRAGVAADRINEVLHTEPSIHDPEQAVQPENLIVGKISFEDVSFRFPGADSDVLDHISFTAEPGKTTAIIGSTGCGKSTLVNLIPRFFDVTEGRITLDGIDIRQLKQTVLRDQIGYVPQKGILFSGDIASNLKFASDDISDEDMKKAAEIAQATEFIDSKIDGYHSVIAQGGTNVSGGQKQRLSIARAIAKHPKIFIFDDSFSALDYKTDATLRHALEEQTDDATVIIVAQRISTILHADQIIVLNDGKIDGIGTHKQLMRNCETYRQIAHSQLSVTELEGGE